MTAVAFAPLPVRDAIEVAAAAQPADLAEDATTDLAATGCSSAPSVQPLDLTDRDASGTGRPPRVTGKTLSTLVRLGDGWLVWDTATGKGTTYPMRTHLVETCDDPAIVPLVTADEVAVALAEAGGHAPTAADVLTADWAGQHARGRL